MRLYAFGYELFFAFFTLSIILIEADFFLSCFVFFENFLPELYWLVFVNCLSGLSVLSLTWGVYLLLSAWRLWTWGLLLIVDKETYAHILKSILDLLWSNKRCLLQHANDFLLITKFCSSVYQLICQLLFKSLRASLLSSLHAWSPFNFSYWLHLSLNFQLCCLLHLQLVFKCQITVKI